MGIELAKAFVTIQVDAAGLRQELNEVRGPVEEVVNDIGRDLGNVINATVAAASIGRLVSFANEALRAGEAQLNMQARLAALLNATGNRLGFNVDQLSRYASELQRVTTFADEQILEAMASLARFQNISSDTFMEVTKLATDLAATGFGDLRSSAEALGRAMLNPAMRVQALRRAGIDFTVEERKMLQAMMETGRVADAQRVILDKLQNSIGGTAERAAKLGSGPLIQLRNVISDVQEEIGIRLVPAFEMWYKIKLNLIKIVVPFVGLLYGMTTALLMLDKMTGSVLFKFIAISAALLTFAIVIPRVIWAIEKLVKVLQILAKTQAIVQALSGPAGWATLAAGIVIAAGAWAGLEYAFNRVNAQVAEFGRGPRLLGLARPGMDQDKIGPGRYGFEEFGQHIQDSLLKEQVDYQAQMVDLLEMGNEKQDELLSAVRNLNFNAGLA